MVSVLLFPLIALALRKRTAVQPELGRRRRGRAVTGYAATVRLSERFLRRKPSQISSTPKTML
jgi:hypothetical protein